MHGGRRPRQVRARHPAIEFSRRSKTAGAQAISHFASRTCRSSWSVAIDVSGSMGSDDAEAEGEAVKEFLGTVPAQNQVTLLGFNRRLRVHALDARNRPTPPIASRRWIGWRRGSTALYDVILRGMDMLGRQDRGRKALVVFTDGEDQGSHATIARRRTPAASRAT